MWSFNISAEVNTVYACLMARQGVVGRLLGSAHRPDLDCLVQGGRGEHVVVFGVDCQLHDVVLMIHKRVNFGPGFIPVKHVDGIIIASREDIGQVGMDNDMSNIVLVLIYGFHLLSSVVVVHSQQVVVTAHDYHLLARNELGTSHRRVCYLKRTNLGLVIVVIDHDSASIERDEYPWERGVHIHTLHSVRSVQQFLLNF